MSWFNLVVSAVGYWLCCLGVILLFGFFGYCVAKLVYLFAKFIYVEVL